MKDHGARSRSGSSCDWSRRSRSCSASRSRSSGRERRRRDLSRLLCGRGATDRCLLTATALIGFALSVTGHVLWSATGHGRNVRDPLLVREVVVRHAIPLATLVTARGHRTSRLFLVTIHGLKKEASKPDVSCGRVGRL